MEVLKEEQAAAVSRDQLGGRRIVGVQQYRVRQG